MSWKNGVYRVLFFFVPAGRKTKLVTTRHKRFSVCERELCLCANEIIFDFIVDILGLVMGDSRCRCDFFFFVCMYVCVCVICMYTVHVYVCSMQYAVYSIYRTVVCVYCVCV